MDGFSQIKDLTRLKTGDIVYFPTAEREPRLRVSVRTFAKMGISVGETKRADNSESRVKKMLVDHPGERGFALMVGETWSRRSYRNGEERFLNLIDNDGDPSSDLVPRCRCLALHSVPVPGEEPDQFECESMWRVLNDRAKARLRSLAVKGSMLFCESLDQRGERFLQCVFEESPDKAGREALPEVPSVGYWVDPDKPIYDDDSDKILVDYYGDGKCVYTDIYDTAFMRVSGKFVENCHRRGAVVMRPSERVLDEMAWTLVPPALRNCAESWLRRIGFVKSFVEGLHRETSRALLRPKGFLAYAAKSAPTKAQSKRLLKESGKAFGHEHRLQVAGDRGDAHAVEAAEGR